MRKLDFKPKFKAELSDIEIEGIERIVDNYSYNYGDIPDTDAMGFAYTSSSSYGMYNVTNYVEFEDDEEGVLLEVSHFAITENEMLIMVAHDKEDNAVYFEIEPSEFN
ncbi:hypothetical protein NUG13_12460 [Bacillus subtilis]|uniref:hypothetical protein n=1 Tax=Bacillus subtilis TaxID=1423 RepID=UPI0021504274|nr:hypothetical protein [Bacillus subtilis]MCR4362143.1 hypothetical protein [Bacillus subtilis]